MRCAIGRTLPLLIALTCFCGCSLFEGDEGPLDLKISGRVTSAADGRPIERVWIQFRDCEWAFVQCRFYPVASTNSDNDGRYSFEYTINTNEADLRERICRRLDLMMLANGYRVRGRVSFICTREPQIVDVALVPIPEV